MGIHGVSDTDIPFFQSVVKPFGITGGDVGSSAGADEHWDLSFLYGDL